MKKESSLKTTFLLSPVTSFQNDDHRMYLPTYVVILVFTTVKETASEGGWNYVIDEQTIFSLPILRCPLMMHLMIHRMKFICGNDLNG